ncbi:MAG: SDR family NAD(P)-dependent oxidoreductase [Bryobacteraceae bacterium]|nr:SDR family NAD(P)-dependent oxidoreductase [Bryobacteraceae bacterium]
MTTADALTPQQIRWRERYGPWAVVTGASDGIGREIAQCLAQRGLNLVLVARRNTKLTELAASLTIQHRITVHACPLDLAQEHSVRTLVSETEHLDVGLLVAAAGFGTSGSFLEANLDAEVNMIDLNCRAVAAMSLLFGRRLAKRGKGGMILLSSLLAFQGVARAVNYSATKAYVQSLAEGLHLEMAPLGVDVLACAPGPVHTGFATRANMQMGMGLQPEDIAVATLDALGHRTTVRPGWLSQLLEASLSTLPRRGRSRILGLVMEGMTRHQNGEAKTQARGSA